MCSTVTTLSAQVFPPMVNLLEIKQYIAMVDQNRQYNSDIQKQNTNSSTLSVPFLWISTQALTGLAQHYPV